MKRKVRKVRSLFVSLLNIDEVHPHCMVLFSKSMTLLQLIKINTDLRWPTRDTLQTKKNRCKQKRNAANKKETLQTKKKRCKQKRNAANKKETLQTKKGTAANIKKKNAANKKKERCK